MSCSLEGLSTGAQMMLRDARRETALRIVTLRSETLPKLRQALRDYLMEDPNFRHDYEEDMRFFQAKKEEAFRTGLLRPSDPPEIVSRLAPPDPDQNDFHVPGFLANDLQMRLIVWQCFLKRVNCSRASTGQKMRRLEIVRQCILRLGGDLASAQDRFKRIVPDDKDYEARKLTAEQRAHAEELWFKTGELHNQAGSRLRWHVSKALATILSADMLQQLEGEVNSLSLIYDPDALLAYQDSRKQRVRWKRHISRALAEEEQFDPTVLFALPSHLVAEVEKTRQQDKAWNDVLHDVSAAKQSTSYHAASNDLVEPRNLSLKEILQKPEFSATAFMRLNSPQELEEVIRKRQAWLKASEENGDSRRYLPDLFSLKRRPRRQILPLPSLDKLKIFETRISGASSSSLREGVSKKQGRNIPVRPIISRYFLPSFRDDTVMAAGEVDPSLAIGSDEIGIEKGNGEQAGERQMKNQPVFLSKALDSGASSTGRTKPMPAGYHSGSEGYRPNDLSRNSTCTFSEVGLNNDIFKAIQLRMGSSLCLKKAEDGTLRLRWECKPGHYLGPIKDLGSAIEVKVNALASNPENLARYLENLKAEFNDNISATLSRVLSSSFGRMMLTQNKVTLLSNLTISNAVVMLEPAEEIELYQVAVNTCGVLSIGRGAKKATFSRLSVLGSVLDLNLEETESQWLNVNINEHSYLRGHLGKAGFKCSCQIRAYAVEADFSRTNFVDFCPDNQNSKYTEGLLLSQNMGGLVFRDLLMPESFKAKLDRGATSLTLAAYEAIRQELDRTLDGRRLYGLLLKPPFNFAGRELKASMWKGNFDGSESCYEVTIPAVDLSGEMILFLNPRHARRMCKLSGRSLPIGGSVAGQEGCDLWDPLQYGSEVEPIHNHDVLGMLLDWLWKGQRGAWWQWKKYYWAEEKEPLSKVS